MFKLFSAMFTMNQLINRTLETALRGAERRRKAVAGRRAAMGLLVGYALAARAKKQISFYSSL